MVFSSMAFMFAFLPIVMIIYYIVPTRFKNMILAVSGIIFYSWGEPLYVFIMLITIGVDYGAGLLMERFRTSSSSSNSKKKCVAVMVLAIIINLGFLGVFKYGSFIVSNINSIFKTDIFDLKLALPVGISFYTFQAMSYLIDLYRGEIKVQRNVVTFASYVTMFPQLIAGPIVRYSDVERELGDRVATKSDIADGIGIFIRGFAKKILLANQIGLVWTTIKAMDYATLPTLTAWLGILAFTFQIYYDFSGYSDMAIGLGRMLGFHFPKNFDHPYLSKSITEFWRRWHMTLGSWFRSYVYIPLGGNRCSKLKHIRNLLIVWGLTGLWHGASWNFVLWGLYFGGLLIGEKFLWGRLLEKLPQWLRQCYSFLLVVFGWVLFEMNTMAKVGGYFAAMFKLNGAMLADSNSMYILVSNLIVFILCAITSTMVIRKGALSVELRNKTAYAATKLFCELSMFAVSLCYLITSSYNPFLYYNF